METIVEKLSRYLILEMNGRPYREVANEIGISHSSLSRAINLKGTSLESFAKIVDWIGVNPSYLLGLTNVDRDHLKEARYNLIEELRILK